MAMRSVAAGMLGFALGGFFDGILLHRIRMDADAPLASDVGWALAFGVPPVLLGARWWRHLGGAAVLPLRVVVFGLGAALPPLDPAVAATLPAACVFASL